MTQATEQVSFRSGKQLGAGLRKFQVGPAFVHRDPAALDCELHPCLIFGRAAAKLEQKLSFDLLDVDSAILHRFDTVSDFHEFPRGGFRRIGSGIGLFHLCASIWVTWPRCPVVTSMTLPEVCLGFRLCAVVRAGSPRT